MIQDSPSLHHHFYSAHPFCSLQWFIDPCQVEKKQIRQAANQELGSMCCVNAPWLWGSSGLPAWALLSPLSQQIAHVHEVTHWLIRTSLYPLNLEEHWEEDHSVGHFQISWLPVPSQFDSRGIIFGH